MTDEQDTINPAGSPIVTNVPAAQPSTDQGSEFNRFKDLTKKLVEVPKTELDEQRKKSKG